MRKTAKLFYNGRSQAVRLPKEFRMPGDEVYISRQGDGIVLEPVERPVLKTLGDLRAHILGTLGPVGDAFVRTVKAARARDRRRGLRDFGARRAK